MQCKMWQWAKEKVTFNERDESNPLFEGKDYATILVLPMEEEAAQDQE